MVQPRLVHPIAIEIEPLLRTETQQDPDYREPVQTIARGTRVTCLGQVHWGRDERLHVDNTGSTGQSDGFITFQMANLRAVGLDRLKLGDHIVAMGVGDNRVEVDIYVIGLSYKAHYPDIRGPGFVRAYFEDRAPAKNNRGGV